MRGDVDVSELHRLYRLVLLEEIVYVTTKGVGDTLPVDFRLGVRLFRRLRWGLSFVDTLLRSAACLGPLVGLSNGFRPDRQNCPWFRLVCDDVKGSIVGRRGSNDIPLSQVDRRVPDVREVEGPRGAGEEL